MTFKVDGNSLKMNSPTDVSYQATMDGTEAPVNGDPGVTTMSVMKTGANSMTETDKRTGKIISITEMTVEPDGQSMKMIMHNKLRGNTSSVAAMKQAT